MATDSEKKKVFIKPFGCQMNEYDSGKMRALLRQERNYMHGRIVHDGDNGLAGLHHFTHLTYHRSDDTRASSLEHQAPALQFKRGKI